MSYYLVGNVYEGCGHAHKTLAGAQKCLARFTSQNRAGTRVGGRFKRYDVWEIREGKPPKRMPARPPPVVKQRGVP